MCREWFRRQMKFYDDLFKRKGDTLYGFPIEWIIVIAIVVLIFGVGKLGNIGGALGKSIREFRQEKDKDKLNNTSQLNTKNTKEEDTKPETKSSNENKD